MDSNSPCRYDDSLWGNSELPSELINTELQPLYPPISDSDFIHEYTYDSNIFLTAFAPTENTCIQINDQNSNSRILRHIGESDLASQCQTLRAPSDPLDHCRQSALSSTQTLKSDLFQIASGSGLSGATSARCQQHPFVDPAEYGHQHPFVDPAEYGHQHPCVTSTAADSHDYNGAGEHQCQTFVYSASSGCSQLNYEANQTENFVRHDEPCVSDSSWDCFVGGMNAQKTLTTQGEDFASPDQEHASFSTPSFEHKHLFRQNDDVNDGLVKRIEKKEGIVSGRPIQCELGTQYTNKSNLIILGCSPESSNSNQPNIWYHQYGSPVREDSTRGIQCHILNGKNFSNHVTSDDARSPLSSSDSLESGAGENSCNKTPKKIKQKRNRLTKEEYAKLTLEQLQARKKMLSSRSSKKYTKSTKEEHRQLAESLSRAARVHEQLQIQHERLQMRVSACTMAVTMLRLSSGHFSKRSKDSAIRKDLDP